MASRRNSNVSKRGQQPEGSAIGGSAIVGTGTPPAASGRVAPPPAPLSPIIVLDGSGGAPPPAPASRTAPVPLSARRVSVSTCGDSNSSFSSISSLTRRRVLSLDEDAHEPPCFASSASAAAFALKSSVDSWAASSPAPMEVVSRAGSFSSLHGAPQLPLRGPAFPSAQRQSSVLSHAPSSPMAPACSSKVPAGNAMSRDAMMEQLWAHLDAATLHVEACDALLPPDDIPHSYREKLFAQYRGFRQELATVVHQFAKFQRFVVEHGISLNHCAQGYFCALPDELIISILAQLSAKEVSHLRATCKFFRRVVEDDGLWKTLYFQKWAPPSKTALAMLQKGKRAKVDWKAAFKRHTRLDASWFANRKREVGRYAGHTGTVYCLQFDAEKVISGSTDSHIKIFERTTGACQQTLAGHEARIRCLRYDDQRVVSGSVDTTIKIWSLSDYTCQHTLRGHSKYVYCVQMDDTKIVSGSGDRTVKIWDFATGTCMNTIQTGGVGVQLVGDCIITGSIDKSIRMWDLRMGGQIVKSIEKVHEHDIWCLEVRGNTVASGSKDTTIKLWDLRTGGRLHTLQGHRSSILTLQMDGQKVVSGARDDMIKVWDVNTGECRNTITDPDLGIVWCLAFDDTHLLAGSNTRVIRQWEFDDSPVRP